MFGRIYRIELSVIGSQPLIWRRFEISADSTFLDLHDVIQVLMNWMDEKKFYFEIGAWLIADPEQVEEADANAYEARLKDYFGAETAVFEYHYADSEGSWALELRVEATADAEEGKVYPHCIDAAEQAPEETLSGVEAFNNQAELHGLPIDLTAINEELSRGTEYINLNPLPLPESENSDLIEHLLIAPQLEAQQRQLDFAKKLFEQYKQSGEKALAQVSEEALFWQANAESNSIAVLVKHLWGNMRSRWTDFLISDGEKPWREREEEFVNDLKTKKAVMDKWEEGWQILFLALDELEAEDWEKTVTIKQEPHLVWQAIQRQMMHYAYHVGQIVLLAKMLKK